MDKNTHFEIPITNIRNESFIPPGGGKSFTRDNFSEHGKKLYNQTINLKKIQENKKDINLLSDYFIEVESPDKLKIKDAKFKIEKLGFEIISYSKNFDNIATAKINKIKYNELENKINDYTTLEGNPNKSYISVIENLKDISIEEKITKEIDLEKNDPENVIISLYNVLSSKEKKVILENIQQELENEKINSEIHTFINGLTAIVCTVSPKKIKTLFDNYSSIREISVNHSTIVEHGIPVENLPNPLNVKTPQSLSKIGIIDTGVENSISIFSNLIVNRFPILPLNSVNSPNDHGTFVASRCIFGDNIDNCLITHTLEPYCKIIDIPVFGVDSSGNYISPDEFHLMKALEEIIPKLADEVKIFNLSLGLNVPITDNSFSLISKLIDYLSKEYGIIFVISSGNISNLLGDFPKEHFESIEARIGSPAESLLSITVGSISKYENENSLSKNNQISPFSRIGPGADYGVKPELVAHGGNLANGFKPLPRIASYGIDKDGIKLSVNNGTSFSAPIISQYAQRLFDLYPKSDTNLIKALLYHFTNLNTTHENWNMNIKNLIGFGEPNINNALYAGIHSGTFIYEGALEVNNYQYIKFHVPSLLSEDNPDAKLKIKITLVYDPPVDPDNDLEYSCSRISSTLIKPISSDTQKEVNVTGEEKYNLPWNPIIKFEKCFSKKYSVGEWFLRLRLFTRKINAKNFIQKYAVVIEVIDINNKINVYNSISNEFGNIYNKIILKRAA